MLRYCVKFEVNYILTTVFASFCLADDVTFINPFFVSEKVLALCNIRFFSIRTLILCNGV